jgi:hypothetical protein
MKRLILAFGVVSVFSTTALAIDIAISTNAGWWSQTAADQEMQDIVNNVTAVSVQLFTINDLDALADWVVAHTGDAAPDILILCGKFPQTLYPSGNAKPNGSLAELFLDDGNTIINTGDYIFYVGTTANNDAGGLQNMMDLPAITMWGDGTPCVPTAEGLQFTPSLPEIPSTRPFFFDQLTGDWYPELILAQTADGTRGDPVIVANSATGGRIGIFYQVADVLTDLRGEVISEWINNWYLPYASIRRSSWTPSPGNGAVEVLRDGTLSWRSGTYAATHDVYLGTVFEDVNGASATDPRGVLVSQGQTDTTYNPASPLEYGRTYYWRVDEVNGAPDNTVFKGAVWSFTTEAYAYPITTVTATASGEQPNSPAANTCNGSGLNAFDQHGIDLNTMWATPGGLPAWIQYTFDKEYKLHELWVWNGNYELELLMGFGAKDVTIECSSDGQTWTAVENVPEFAQGTATTTYTANTFVNLGEVMAKHVKLTVNATWGVTGIVNLSEVRFFYTPVQAFEPDPADGATGVALDATLNWRPGHEATSHQVSFGADPNALVVETVTDHRYTPASMDLETVYYWKVDEVGDAGTYAGDVWSFTTQEFLVVDDFESYTDDMDAEEAVFQTWSDGYEDDTNGSIVGLQDAVNGTFCETSIVHGGGQSMPVFYDNSGAATYAEAKRIFDDGQDWTASGIQSLSLWFRGTIGNTGTLYIKLNNTKVTYNGSATDIGIGGWQRWNIVLADTGAKLSNVTTLTIGVEGAGAKGVLYVDDIRLYPKVFTPPTSNIGIAISAQANWWSQAAADREMQEIVDNAQTPVVVFNASDQDGLADWLSNHTSNGVANLLILCGQLPDTIYAPGNTQADDSIVEQFLDGGNTIINTGDWIFYVVNGAGTNGAAGLQTIMDIPDVTVSGEDNTAVTVTAEGQEFTPSLQDFATDRPFHLDTLAGDWSTELVLAQNAAGTRADPVVVRNSATGGRIGVFYQTANQDNDPRGEVISEWINNWYLDAVSGGN